MLSSLGVDWDAWSETTSLSVDDGSVFWLAPDAAPGGEVVVAQLTVPTGSSGTVKMGMQGRATGGGDWNVHEVIFTYPLTVCIDLISFQALLNSVNRACCDDVGEDCSAGYPTVCSTHCAMHLIPAWNHCADFLADSNLAETRLALERAVQVCTAPDSDHEPPHEHPCMDLDSDGYIGVSDLLRLLSLFGGPAQELHTGDAVADGTHTGYSHGDVVDVIDLLNLLPDFGRRIDDHACMEAAVGETVEYLDAVVTTVATSAPGFTTYRLIASLHDTAANLYSIEGTALGPMELPAAYQVAAPFGVDFGGANPLFFAIMPMAAFDSWLTIGVTDGSDQRALATIGIDFRAWTESAGLLIDDGSLFYMDPNSAPGGDVVVAQLTVPSGASGTVVMGMQGHAVGGGDWDVHHVIFVY